MGTREWVRVVLFARHARDEAEVRQRLLGGVLLYVTLVALALLMGGHTGRLLLVVALVQAPIALPLQVFRDRRFIRSGHTDSWPPPPEPGIWSGDERYWDHR